VGRWRSTITVMLQKSFRYLFRGILLLALGSLLVLGIPNLIASSYTRARQYSIEDAPRAPVAIVFGAGLQRNGTPSAVLRDRVETAADLYHAEKVEKLLMSGDNRFVEYNEPAAMRDYAISLGVPEEDIVLDFAGRRTYDTCYRARHIFDVQQATLITQNFHLARALFTCNNLGIEADGVSADVRRYRRLSYAFWILREVAATSMAVWDVWVIRPLPVLGQPEPIFPRDAGAERNNLTGPLKFARD
jgi:SanA protein